MTDEYETNEHGRITSPGKFEGELAFAPYFYEQFLDGGADVDIGGWLIFNVTEEDRAKFPELLDGVDVVALFESEVGFVHCQEMSRDSADNLIAELESEAEQDAE